MMKKTFYLTITALAIGALALLAGCSSDHLTSSEELDGLNLTAEFGGYTAVDEAPAFGDAEIAGLMMEDAEVDDPIFVTGELDSLEGIDGVRVYALAVRWGMLEYDSTVTQTTDWSGMLNLKYGSLHVARLIRFERGQDYVARPRPNRQTVEWVSLTNVSYDGLLITLVIPPAPEGEDWSDNRLLFRTVPYTREFAIGELEDLDEIVDIDELGNQVSFSARGVDPEPCGSGHLEGRWLLNPSGGNGRFFGRWLTDEGVLRGHLRGHFGTRSNDRDSVFFGKFVGGSGEFRGLLRGVWGTNPDDSTSGWYSGIWAGRDGRPIGRLSGHWSSGPPPENGDPTVNDHPGDRPRDGHGPRNPRNHPVFGSDRWIPGYFGGTWVKLCPESPDGGGDAS